MNLPAYKMRSFSFPLYPYPRYRTPSSDEGAVKSSEKYDTPAYCESPPAYSPGFDPSSYFAPEKNQRLSEVINKMDSTGQHAAILASIARKVRNINQDVTACEESMDTFLTFSAILFFCLLLLPLGAGLSVAKGTAVLAWTTAFTLNGVVAFFALSVKERLQRSEDTDRQLDPLRRLFNVRLFRLSSLQKSMAFPLASLLPILLHLTVIFSIISVYATFFNAPIGSIMQLFTAVGTLTTVALYVFHASTSYSPLRLGVQVVAPAIVRAVLSLSLSLQTRYATSMGSMDLVPKDKEETADEEFLTEFEGGPSVDVVRTLIAADYILMDDEMLVDEMLPVLLQTSPSAETSMYFVYKMLGNRLPGLHLTKQYHDSPGILDLSGLSRRAWEVAINIVAGVVEQHLNLLGEGPEQAPAFVEASGVGTDVSVTY
ncbi:hypothetical protein NM688_g9331 [Phlebia brevispora]|uniref:Uncharacterized protein n=1 Tax=Phlebia brevispora TaxID=194682 RepID=A0ACC1RI53_9APHY|nr:hypothetical protein NM688_g9331 [Phlebia brevispora]